MALQLFSFCPGGEQALLSPPDAPPPIELQQEPLPAKPAKRRAKHPDGKFVADDPATPEVDEAWVEEKRENLDSES